MASSFLKTARCRGKSQAALEYMIVVGLAFLILAPIALEGWKSADGFSRDLNILNAKNALDQISDAAKIVYFQGPPSTMTIKVTYPDRIIASNVSGREAYFRMAVAGSPTDIVALFDFNVTGDISGGPGERTIYIEAVHNDSIDYDFVNITRTG